jgi:staphylopine/pseudopaline/yersinopine synthase
MAQSVLLLGTGPASIQLAVILKQFWGIRTGIAGRESSRSSPFFSGMEQAGNRIHAHVQNQLHKSLEGGVVVDQVFRGYETVTGTWDMILLTVTADAYIKVLQQINRQTLEKARCIVLISPTLGSNSLVSHFMKPIHASVEVISFSTYLGDTRRMSENTACEVITTGVKKKLYTGSDPGSSKYMDQLGKLFAQLGIAMEVKESPLEAESKNLSLYVHPALFMNDYSLKVIFGEEKTKRYVYKMFPEGPITQELIHHMLAGWKEMTGILAGLGIKGVNLLKFMTDDSYPVREESLPRYGIEHFLELETLHQEYLLYVRYTSLLIDPFSEPDQEGRYFDFSAVPIRQIFLNHEGIWDIPRMPSEDYYRLKIIQGIGRYAAMDCPVIDRWISAYEAKLEEAARRLQGAALSEAFFAKTFEEDLKRICSRIRLQKDSRL